MHAHLDCDGDLMTTKSMTKRTAAGTLALAACIGGGALALASSADAATPAGATIVVATGGAPYDSVTAGPLAVKLGAPILLTAPSLYLDPLVRDYIEDAERDGRPVTRIVIVGGPEAVTYGAAVEMRRLVPDVGRIYGSDRYGTSIAVADVLGGRATPVK